MNQQLRLIFPKGVSLSNISLEQGYLFASNMNARILSSIDDTTPAKLFINIFGKEALDKLNLTLIEPKDVFFKSCQRLTYFSLGKRERAFNLRN